MVLDAHSHELSKRPRVRRSHLQSRDSLPGPTAFGNVSPGASQQAFTLPPDVPHPTATIGDLLGLEFSEADLERYAELYEKGSERWSKSTMEEWVAGANDIMARFTEMLDMVSYVLCSRAWDCLRGVFRSPFSP